MKTFITFILLSVSYIQCNAQWVELNVGSTTATYFTDVYAITPDIVFVVGNNGTILKSTDGGTTWQQKDSGTNQYLQKVRFSNVNVGYIIGEQGVLLKTSDGGESWVSIDTGHTVNFMGLSSVGENIVYIAYEDNLLKSEDSGTTWQNNSLDFYNGDVQFLTSEIGYASKSNGGMLKTINGGENWQGLSGYYRFHFINNNTGFCYMNGLRKTNDGGNNFEQLGDGNKSFLKIFAINENTVWGIITPILNGDGTSPGTVKMTYSSENGYSESVEYDDNNTDMSSLYFSNDKLGYSVGMKNGKAAIWKNTTGNTMAVNENQFNNPINIYPNPASNEVNIDLGKLTGENVNISIIDITGKAIYFKSYTSTKKIKLNTSKFLKGNYILTVETKLKKYSQKLIIQ